jgi:hypothetical protein
MAEDVFEDAAESMMAASESSSNDTSKTDLTRKTLERIMNEKKR